MSTSKPKRSKVCGEEPECTGAVLGRAMFSQDLSTAGRRLGTRQPRIVSSDTARAAPFMPDTACTAHLSHHRTHVGGHGCSQPKSHASTNWTRCLRGIRPTIEPGTLDSRLLDHEPTGRALSSVPIGRPGSFRRPSHHRTSSSNLFAQSREPSPPLMPVTSRLCAIRPTIELDNARGRSADHGPMLLRTRRPAPFSAARVVFPPSVPPSNFTRTDSRSLATTETTSQRADVSHIGGPLTRKPVHGLAVYYAGSC
ncbi:hypothetical protein DENSPDRAFT_880655 [Dentipellis sp. KUC8613]|nr:hypothetical protein DENSPDRAFT_880655 [Dentipellis sp. KUC8613]